MQRSLKANSHINNSERALNSKVPKPQAPKAQVPCCQHAVFGACFPFIIKPSSLWTQNPFLENHDHLLELEGDFYLPGNSKGCIWYQLLLVARGKVQEIWVSSSFSPPLKKKWVRFYSLDVLYFILNYFLFNKYMYSTYHVPGTVLNNITHLIVITTLPLFYRRRNLQMRTLSTERSGNLPKVTQLMSGEAKVQTQGVWLKSLFLLPSMLLFLHVLNYAHNF